MRAFISHTFAESDVALAARLDGALRAGGDTGYMAKKHLEYDLLIHEKIKSAIAGSDYLVAIITREGQTSPSVHEEIGYALGRGVPVLIMLERGVKMRGVFAHGKEPEEFDRDQFDVHAKRIVEYMRRHQGESRGQGAPEGGEPGTALLERRNTADTGSGEFAQNEHYKLLYDWTMNEYAKRAIVFTACPRRLKPRMDVAGEKFEEWAKGRRGAATPTSGGPVRGRYIERDMDSLVFYDRKEDAPNDQSVRSYCEFRSDGYFETGTASRYVYTDGRERVLHLCHMIGAFWRFVEEAKRFYAEIEFDGPFDVLLSISKSSGLVLGNFGNEALRHDYEGSQEQKKMRGMFKRARQENVQVSCGFGGARDLTDAAIRGAAHDAATKIAHAYGQKEARCFGEGGNFAWKLWRDVERNSA